MNEQIEIKIIEYGSEDYIQTLSLREKVLRIPLGLKLSPKDTEGENRQIHIGAFLEGKLLGCLTISPQISNTVKIRQVAVITALQKTGIGKALVLFAENYATEHNFSKIIIHSRLVVKGFYTTLGYKPIGEEFLEIGLKHIKMTKSLEKV